MNAPATAGSIRADLLLIADMIRPGARVLDVGCDDGALLAHLVRQKSVDGRGIELSQEGVNSCVSHGLSVVQGDAETDLKDYPSDSFDYVILSQTLPAIRDIKGVLEQLLRIGARGVVSFPNFGHWRVRWSLLRSGRAPVTRSLPDIWHETPNIRMCTLGDFADLCRDMGIRIEQAIAVRLPNRARNFKTPDAFTNLTAEQAVFLLSRS